MVAILKLRWMKLKDEIKMLAVMTGMTLVMISVFAGINYSSEATYLGFIDEENSELSQLLYETLTDQEGYEFTRYTLEEGKEAVKDGKVSGAFYVKEGFSENVLSGNVTIDRLLVTENMGNMQMNNVLSIALNKAVQDYKLSNVLSTIIGEDISLYVRDVLKEHWTYKKPIEVTSISLREETAYDSTKHSVVGFSLFFAMFTIVFGVGDILVEKEQNTWQRQLVSPISKFSILSGNMLVTFLIGLIQVSSMFIISRYVFKVDFAGNMLHTVIVIAAFVFCVTSIGMFLSNFVNTIGQLSAISPVIITGTAMLGGCFWPLEIVTSKIMLGIANITPQKWAINAIEKITIYGYGLNDILFNVAVLVGMGVVYLLLGTYFLEKKSR